MAKTLERSLDLTIRLKTNEEGEVSEINVNVLEPESGESNCIHVMYSPDVHPEFDENIGREIYSWLSLWVEQLEENPDCGDEEEDEETCPVCGASIELCGGEDNGYGELRMPWSCDHCGTEGNAFFDLTDGNRFVRHEWDESVDDHAGKRNCTEMRNTEISYLYRDASNYKTHITVVLEGLLTTDEIAAILQTRNDGEFFIPDQVGLPEERGGELNEQDDHIWFVLPDDAFSPTNRMPTHIGCTAKEMAENFKIVGGNWDEEAANQRLWGC